MSRHRNIKNLTEDDYYDYDDDYYDEDYDEDDYYWEQEQERLRKEEEAARQKAAAAKLRAKTSVAKKTTAPVKKVVTIAKTESTSMNTSGMGKSVVNNSSSGPNQSEQLERERLVVSMGFSSDKAKVALKKHGWDVQAAINDLLSNPDMGGRGGGGMAPPPGLSKPKTSTKSYTGGKAAVKGAMAPPPGMSKPSSNVGGIKSVMAPPSGISISKPKATGLNDTNKLSNNIRNNQTSSLTRSTGDKVMKEKAKSMDSSMKRISPEMQKRLKAQKSRLTMVILGHVDAGKSTLMGQVLVQMGKVEKRTVNKYAKQAGEIGKASFALAWIMDEDESERERGVTIDIATKQISTKTHDITILDAPGHADYVPAMITGAGVSDVGILVISSTRGEFESGFDTATVSSGGARGHMGQTREHITLARGLGVSQMIVAVNKLDAAEPAWSQQRFEEIQARLTPFLKSNGFNLDRVQFVPISGLTGANIKSPPSKLDGSEGLAGWYRGKTLIGAINSFQAAKRNLEKPFRFITSDLYAEGKGIVVKGRVAQGFASVGDKVCVLPIGDEAVVTRIEHGDVGEDSNAAFDEERRKVAIAGDSAEFVLTGIDMARISVGNILSDAATGLRPAKKKKFQAKIIVMEDLAVPIIHGSQVLMHMHCMDKPAVISKIISKVDKKSGNTVPSPRVLTGGVTATVEIKLKEKVCLETYGECRSLGRFALRRGGDTVAVGIIESV